jgi:hypothetical protein
MAMSVPPMEIIALFRLISVPSLITAKWAPEIRSKNFAKVSAASCSPSEGELGTTIIDCALPFETSVRESPLSPKDVPANMPNKRTILKKIEAVTHLLQFTVKMHSTGLL